MVCLLIQEWQATLVEVWWLYPEDWMICLGVDCGIFKKFALISTYWGTLCIQGGRRRIRYPISGFWRSIGETCEEFHAEDTGHLDQLGQEHMEMQICWCTGESTSFWLHQFWFALYPRKQRTKFLLGRHREGEQSTGTHIERTGWLCALKDWITIL